MAIKPILFNAEMVWAILEGRKTQTRRLVRKKYSNTDIVIHTDKYGTRLVERQNDAPTGNLVAMCEVPKPFHRGDILWVRETWAHTCIHCEHYPDMFCCPQDCGTCPEYVYKADGISLDGWPDKRWRPSIHMPKEAARIFLRVKDVRVQRLLDMGYDDLASEGLYGWDRFISLWDSTINPADEAKYGWNANPWVWVIEFERCEKPEGWCE